jgi:hypothetical protein
MTIKVRQDLREALLLNHTYAIIRDEREGKVIEGKVREGKVREGKVRKGKVIEGKVREGK